MTTKQVTKKIKVKGEVLSFDIENGKIKNDNEITKLHKMLRGLLIMQSTRSLGKVYTLEFTDLYNYHLEELCRAVVTYRPRKDEVELKSDSFIPFYIRNAHQQVVRLVRKYNKNRMIDYQISKGRTEKAEVLKQLLSGNSETVEEVQGHADTGKLGAVNFELSDEGFLVKQAFVPIRKR